MRITKDLLHKYAQETVKQRQRTEPDLHGAYLTGSLLSDQPLLGGTTDIDLVFVHKYQAPIKRETITLTPEISLDIVHKIQDDYAQHRELRKDPCLGYPLTHYNIVLYDTDHWLEFIQSCANADFHRPDFVLTRVNTFIGQAREKWFDLNTRSFENQFEWLDQFLDSLALAANAVSGLIGAPLTLRRFMITYRERLETLGVPQILAGFTGLLGFTDIPVNVILEWATAFENDYDHLLSTDNPPIHLAACRRAYYADAIRTLADSGDANQASWPLLRTWLDIQRAAGKPTPESETWNSCLETLGLTQETAPEKAEALDAYLDQIEVTIESWANKYGV